MMEYDPKTGQPISPKIIPMKPTPKPKRQPQPRVVGQYYQRPNGELARNMVGEFLLWENEETERLALTELFEAYVQAMGGAEAVKAVLKIK